MVRRKIKTLRSGSPLSRISSAEGRYDRSVRIVVNHLSFTEPIPRDVVDSAEQACQQLVEAGGISASLVQEDDHHATLLLTFPDLETEERIRSEIGGPWMNEHVVALLAKPPERSPGTVVAGSY